MMAFMNWRMVQAAELLGSGFQVQALSRCFFVGTLIRFWQCWKPKGASMAFFRCSQARQEPDCGACCAAGP